MQTISPKRFLPEEMVTIPLYRFTKQIMRAFCFLILLSIISIAHAQEYRGTILGQVTDPKGALVPHAAITATGPQQTYSAKSGTNGNYTIPFVQPGTYTVSAEAPGFKKIVQRNVFIDVSSKINVNFTLELGSVSETVSVEASQNGLSTADASGGTVMDPEKVENLPLNGRQVYMLLALTPGVKFTQTQLEPVATPAHAGGTSRMLIPSAACLAAITNSC